jgi:hypothetical protein
MRWGPGPPHVRKVRTRQAYFTHTGYFLHFGAYLVTHHPRATPVVRDIRTPDESCHGFDTK